MQSLPEALSLVASSPSRRGGLSLPRSCLLHGEYLQKQCRILQPGRQILVGKGIRNQGARKRGGRETTTNHPLPVATGVAEPSVVTGDHRGEAHCERNEVIGRSLQAL